MPFTLERGNIVTISADAIVNAANSALAPGGGVCGSIFAAAGYEQLDRACRRIGRCAVGQAVATPAFALKARYVIHAVGPIWRGGGYGEAALLRSAYRSALELASRKECQSIAFPLISAGIYGYPQTEAFRIAVTTIQNFLLEHDMQVTLVLYDGRVPLERGRLAELQSFLDDNLVPTAPAAAQPFGSWTPMPSEPRPYDAPEPQFSEEQPEEAEFSFRPFETQPDGAASPSVPSETAPDDAAVPFRPSAAQHPDAAIPSSPPQASKGRCFSANQASRSIFPPLRRIDRKEREESEESAPSVAEPLLSEEIPELDSPAYRIYQRQRSLRDLLGNLQESFSQMLLRLVDEKGMTDVEVYKRANLDRKLFSKLRRRDYRPSKQTAVALAIALRLNLDETRDFLGRAGYALSPCSRADVIVQFFIEERIFDIFQVNEALFAFGEKLLGA